MNALPWHKSLFERLSATKSGLPHALLLSGPRGIGKLAFARALSQAFLCEAPAADGRACDACAACNWFASGAHPDCRQIEPVGTSVANESEEGEKKASTISVDQIRALPDFINLSSHRGGPKVVVVHPAETLNVNAANALLKSLEEPPPRTFFLLVAHRPHQLLATIKSRCQQITLPAPDAAGARSWLAAQGVGEPEVALAHTGGAPLLALELNDTEFWSTRAAFFRQLTARDIDVLGAAEAVRDFPIPHVIAWLQKWSYDIAHFGVLGRVRYNPDYEDAIAHVAAEVDALSVSRFHREMVRLQRIAHHPLNARLFIEHLLLAYRDLLEPQKVAA